jgi:hypothetical protein
LNSYQDIVNQSWLLDNKWPPRLGIPLRISPVLAAERRCPMSARIQALLLVLGAIAAAAFNGATPWGP